MNAAAFFKEIGEKRLKRVYLLQGEEEYAQDRAIEALGTIIDESVRDFNVDRLDNPSVENVIATCRTLPMMSDFRIVLLRDVRLFSAAAGEAQRLIDFLPDIPQRVTMVILLRGKADGRNALTKAIKQMDGVVDFDLYSEGEAARWAKSFTAKRGVTISLQQAQKLVMMTGRKLSDIAAEATKLCDYVEKGVVSDTMIEQIVRRNLEYSVFEMLDYFVSGKLDKALSLLTVALEEEGFGASIKLTAFFASRLRAMLTARRALDAGKSPNSAAALVGGNPYAAKKSVQAAQNFTAEQLQQALLLLADVDLQVKSGMARGDEALTVGLVRIFSGIPAK